MGGGDSLGDGEDDDERESLEDLEDVSFDADAEVEKWINTKTPRQLMICMVNMSMFSS